MAVASSAVCGRRWRWRNLDAAHQHALGHKVGAHFARADDADADRAVFVGAFGEIAARP